MSVRRAQAEINAAEFVEWWAWLRMQETPDTESLVPSPVQPKPRQSVEQMQNVFATFAAAHNASLKVKGK